MTTTVLKRLGRGATALAMTALMLAGTTGLADASGQGHGKGNAKFSTQASARGGQADKKDSDNKRGQNDDRKDDKRGAPMARVAAVQIDKHDRDDHDFDDRDGRPGWGCGDKNHFHFGPFGRDDKNPCEKKNDVEQRAVGLAVSAPASVTAGSAFNFTVTAQNRKGETVTSFDDVVHFVSSDRAASLPDSGALVNGSGTFSATMKTTGGQVIWAIDTEQWGVFGHSAEIKVTGVAAPAVHLALSAPTSVTAGEALQFTVTATDSSNNPVTSLAGTVHVTSSDAGAVLPADSGLTNGNGTFSATLKTAGSQTISATVVGNSSISGTSSAITVGAAPVSHLAVSAPTTSTAGASLQFTVTALDQFSNTVTGYGHTLHYTSSDSAAVLPSDTTLTSGSGTFSAKLNTAGNQTITVTDTTDNTIAGTSGSIMVS